MISLDGLRHAYSERERQGTLLAGSIMDLDQRASVYYQLFLDSGRSHVFPLIAAHGALWAGGYFSFGMKLGTVLSLPWLVIPKLRQRRMQLLRDFANAFREVNRRVCVDTYASFHFSESHGDHPEANTLVPEAMLEGLARVHSARRLAKQLGRIDRQRVFEAFFRAEQSVVVGPSVRRAEEEFRWPLMRFLALRPCIHFAFFPQGTSLWFRNFAHETERIANGLKALSIAESVGLDLVEDKLWNYKVSPRPVTESTVR
jgi:hypothetical protein